MLMICELIFYDYNFNYDYILVQFVNTYNSLNDNETQKREIWMKAKNVYTFIARLQDLKYILNAKIIFKRYQFQYYYNNLLSSRLNIDWCYIHALV